MTPFAILTEDAIKVKDYFIKKIQEKYSIKIINLYENADALIIEDSLIILISIYKFPDKYLSINEKGLDCSSLEFEELTYNNINFKHNHTKFLKEIEEELNIHAIKESVSYIHYKGLSKPFWYSGKNKMEQVADDYPELQLRERYNAWEGIEYNIMLLRIKDYSGNIIYVSTYTTNKPYTYLNNLVKDWIKHGFRCSIGNFYPNGNDLIKAFESYKNTGISRNQRIEENLSYYSYSKYFREKSQAGREVYNCYKAIKENRNFNNITFTPYIKPVNQWKSEELVYKLTKKIYKDYEVIYQHKPFFLKSDKGGQMSYDVFITKLNVAIEYQGKQHFEPVDFFGGEESFKEGQERDILKREISKKHGIKLVYINYWEDINEQLIKEKVEDQ